MKSINENPYRIAGLLSSASEREITKQKSKIKKFSSIGKEIKSDYDFTFLEKVDRSGEILDKAFSEIEHAQGKVNHSIFWFLKTNSFDETALNHLMNGNKEKALELWSKVTLDKEISLKNYSCFNNLGTILLSAEDLIQIQKGIELKIKLIESSQFNDFVLTIADETLTINSKKQLEVFIDDVLFNLRDVFSDVDIQKLFTNSSDHTKKYLASKFTNGPIEEIESKIQSAKTKRNDSKEQLYEIGSQLYNDCKTSLDSLKGILGDSDLKFQMIADNLAKEVMQCGIDFFNHFRDIKDPSAKSLKLIELAKSIALGQATIDRINENYEAIKEWSEGGVVNSDIEFLANIIKNWESNIRENSNDKLRINGANETLNLCLPKIKNIEENLGRDDETYIKICSAIVNMCMNTIIEFLNLRAEWASKGYMTSDDPKANVFAEAVRDLNGFDWNLVKQYKDLMKEAISLMNRLSNLNMSPESRKYLQENRKIIIQNELQYRTVPHSQKQAEFVAKKRSQTSNTGGCYIATMAYGDYDHPQVLELRRFRDEVLLRNDFGKILVKFYYTISPHIVRVLKDQKSINKLIKHLLDRLIEKLKTPNKKN